MKDLGFTIERKPGVREGLVVIKPGEKTGDDIKSIHELMQIKDKLNPTEFYNCLMALNAGAEFIHFEYNDEKDCIEISHAYYFTDEFEYETWRKTYSISYPIEIIKLKKE